MHQQVEEGWIVQVCKSVACIPAHFLLHAGSCDVLRTGQSCCAAMTPVVLAGVCCFGVYILAISSLLQTVGLLGWLLELHVCVKL